MWAKLRRCLLTAVVAAFWLGVWALVCYLANRSLLLPLPYPWDVAVSLWNLLGKSDFWRDVLLSFLRIVAGFAGAVVVGVLSAVLTTRSPLCHRLLAPAMAVVRAVPVASFIFLAFLWIAPDTMPSFIAFLMVVPLVWENVRQGILQTDGSLLEMAQVFSLSRPRQLRVIWIPSVRPFFRVALTTGFGFAWKSGIAAEIICTTGHSIGAQIAASKSALDYAEVFASTVVIVILSVVLEWLLRHLLAPQEVAK